MPRRPSPYSTTGAPKSSASSSPFSARKSGGTYTKVGGSKALGGPAVGGPAGASGREAAPRMPSMTGASMPATPAISDPERPNLPPIDPVGYEKPEHTALRDRYTDFGEDLKSGTGFAMDVLEGQQQDRMEAQIEMAREQAAAAGIPFDEAAQRSELQRGVNASMAQEKLGREGLYQSHLSDIAPVTAGADYAQGEKAIDLQRDTTEGEQLLDRYRTDVGKYGTDVQAAARASEMLMDFYKSLMSGMMSMGGSSFTGGNVRFG